MILCFTLTMPGVASWNGKWSGQDRFYAKARTFSKRQDDKAKQILLQRSYSYRWSDGWAARVSVREIKSSEAAKIRKSSNGFCGYDWMIDSIIQYGAIFASHEIPTNQESAKPEIDNVLR